MATVPVQLGVTVLDEMGVDKSAPYYALADDTKTIAAMVTEAAAFVSALDSCTGSVIHKYRLELVPALPGGLKTTAETNNRAGQTGNISFVVNGTKKKYTAHIPGLSNGATVFTADKIVLTGADPVGLLIAILTTVGTVLTWCSEHQQQIANFLSAFVSFLKARKQTQRATFEV